MSDLSRSHSPIEHKHAAHLALAQLPAATVHAHHGATGWHPAAMVTVHCLTGCLIGEWIRGPGFSLQAGSPSELRMSHPHQTYLPAAGLDLFLPFHDPLVKLLGADRARKKLFDQASVRPQHRVLDIGCGTGTFAVTIKGWLPTVEVVGLDPDPKALARGRRKAVRAGVSIRFDQGFADALPYTDASFDRVFSSLMFHHLPHHAKLATMREVRRVLKPGGSVHLLDFEQEGSHSHNPLARWLHSSERMQDNTREQILNWMREADLFEPRVVDSDQPIFGKVVYFAAGTVG